MQKTLITPVLCRGSPTSCRVAHCGTTLLLGGNSGTRTDLFISSDQFYLLCFSLHFSFLGAQTMGRFIM